MATLGFQEVICPQFVVQSETLLKRFVALVVRFQLRIRRRQFDPKQDEYETSDKVSKLY